MLDTTWFVLRQYVTAFLVAEAQNTSFPLAFALGAVEACELYPTFYDVSRNRFCIELSDFIIESDHSSGLRKFCETNHILQRLYLGHFWASLKDRAFAVYVTLLVKNPTRHEFERLCQADCAPLTNTVNPIPDTGEKRARRDLRKLVWLFFMNQDRSEAFIWGTRNEDGRSRYNRRSQKVCR
jgi:hypothetical protein